MTVKLFAGTLCDRPNESYLVWADDELDAERFVAATLGEPSAAREIPSAEGTCLSFTPREGVLVPHRLAPNLDAQRALVEPAAPPA